MIDPSWSLVLSIIHKIKEIKRSEDGRLLYNLRALAMDYYSIAYDQAKIDI